MCEIISQKNIEYEYKNMKDNRFPLAYNIHCFSVTSSFPCFSLYPRCSIRKMKIKRTKRPHLEYSNGLNLLKTYGVFLPGWFCD